MGKELLSCIVKDLKRKNDVKAGVSWMVKKINSLHFFFMLRKSPSFKCIKGYLFKLKKKKTSPVY